MSQIDNQSNSKQTNISEPLDELIAANSSSSSSSSTSTTAAAAAAESKDRYYFYSIGDFGYNSRELYQTAAAMDQFASRHGAPEFVLGLGDNMYLHQDPELADSIARGVIIGSVAHCIVYKKYNIMNIIII